MRTSEAQWIGQALARIEGPLLNLGSSTGAFRTQAKPHIDQHVFAPLRARNIQIIHADMKDAPGVDIVGDVLDPAFQRHLTTLGVRSLLVSNLLEHVSDPQAVAQACRLILPHGGTVCVTGPYDYPYHADPIDTMYRPTPQEFAELFEGELVRGDIIDGGALRDDVSSLPRYLAQSVWRIANWPRRPLAARSRASALPYLLRPYRISCALIRVHADPERIAGRSQITV